MSIIPFKGYTRLRAPVDVSTIYCSRKYKTVIFCFWSGGRENTADWLPSTLWQIPVDLLGFKQANILPVMFDFKL